jgi:L-asparaginase II
LGGGKPSRVHNNCSGKHTGFLLLARECGTPLPDYLDSASVSQLEVHAAVAEMTGLTPPLHIGLDGCGAPTFCLPIGALARAFSRLANPDGLPSVRAAACRTIVDAAGKAPVHLAGERRICTAFARLWPGHCFPKNGAEGVYALALDSAAAGPRWPMGLGIAAKMDDGAERGYLPVVVELLRHLGVFPGDRVPDALAGFHRVPLQNTQRHLVGHVSCAAEWGWGA